MTKSPELTADPNAAQGGAPVDRLRPLTDDEVAAIEPVSISMDGFTANEMIAIEDYFDLDFQDVAKAMTGEAKLTDDDGKPMRMGSLIRTLAWLKLRVNYPGITIEQAGDVPLALNSADEGADSD